VARPRSGGGKDKLVSSEVATAVSAVELVRRGNQTGVVLLSSSGLEFLTICT
jgi:hypothetical protein